MSSELASPLEMLKMMMLCPLQATADLLGLVLLNLQLFQETTKITEILSHGMVLIKHNLLSSSLQNLNELS